MVADFAAAGILGASARIQQAAPDARIRCKEGCCHHGKAEVK
jgi:hypothetical protein